MTDSMPTKKPRWYERPNLPIWILIGGIVWIHAFLLFQPYRGSTWIIDSRLAAEYGDFIGGYLGSIFLLVNLVLIFATLQSQRRFFQEQQFQSRFFELLKAHRDNANEITLMNKSGRRVFVVLVREFDEVLRLTKEVFAALNLTYEPKQRIEIAYLAFFCGVGKHSTPTLRNTLRDYPIELVNALVDKLEQNRAAVKKDLSFDHDPFDGHQSRLGHYFRHLYQSIKYVHSIPVEVEKYEFAKTLRAQLTNHEQVLLFYNSLSRIGRAWETDGFITKYKLIKNIPQGFVTELDPKQVYPHVKFEWEE